MRGRPIREPGQTVADEYRRAGALRYAAQGREIVGRNGAYFNNRPLYGPANAEGVALAGDRPFVRLLVKGGVGGALAAGLVRHGAGRWFHDYAEVETRYRCGRMTWRFSDPSAPFAGELTVVPLAGGAGFAAHFSAAGLERGDRLVWMFGGAKAEDSPRTRWDPVNRGNPQVQRAPRTVKEELTLGLVAEWSRGNEVALAGAGFRLAASPGSPVAVAGRSDRGGVRIAADAAAAAAPGELARSAARDLPVACETVELAPGSDELWWTFAAGGAADSDPRRDFAAGLAYVESVERLRADTPDAALDAAVAAVCHPIDGNCERDPFIFRHGCMTWSMRFLGWRTMHGATVLGWHERVKGSAAYYMAAQHRESHGRTQPCADSGLRLCHEGAESRFYGQGRIGLDQGMYDMQTQFFDQVIHDWRWTADAELEAILRPALELHLEWARECFDPDDDGLYESYINTLPTDSMWYNGGGGVEESAYIHYGHRAAADLARRAGDAAGETRHRARAEKIARALRAVLWLEDRGHYGAYVEQGGHRRVHADSWTYSQFMPIDAGLSLPEEALQALYFTEWGVERIRLPFGGVVCQQSNWIPYKWSVRDMFSGDLCSLALAYFQSGLPDEGWDLLRGTTLEGCFAGAVPGGFSHIGAGADFGDSVHMYARVVAEGLFGYDPDYPNGVVRLHPAFPSDWPRASFRAPDFALEYRRDGDTDRYRLELANAAAVEFRLIVRAAGVARATAGGSGVAWRAEPGFGCTILCVRLPSPASGPCAIDLAIELTARQAPAPAVHLEGRVGDPISLERSGGVLFQDFHGILEDPTVTPTAITARLAAKPGHHIVLLRAGAAALPQHRVFKIHVTDPAGEAARAARTPRQAPPGAEWACLDLGPQLNGDVCAIFRQQYLSPRPKTCSVRLGVDGYSAWTFPHWKEGPPEIDLAHLDGLSSGAGRIRTPQGASFARPEPGRNIAFTSLWDNWPRAVTVPVGLAADAVWLLICGSTFPMQTRIANAELRFRYADGQVERLELVPPLNFWSLCPWGGLDYDYESDAYCLPPSPPPTVQLGGNCRAMVLSWTLRPGRALAEVTLETLSQDVVIGLMGVSLMNPSPRADP